MQIYESTSFRPETDLVAVDLMNISNLPMLKAVSSRTPPPWLVSMRGRAGVEGKLHENGLERMYLSSNPTSRYHAKEIKCACR